MAKADHARRTFTFRWHMARLTARQHPHDYASREPEPVLAPFAAACRRLVDRRKLLFFGTEVPVWWLWHRQRLLPAVIAAALTATGQGQRIGEGTRVINFGEVWQEHIPDDVVAHLPEVLPLMEIDEGLVTIDPLVYPFVDWLETTKHWKWRREWMVRVRNHRFADGEMTRDPAEIVAINRRSGHIPSIICFSEWSRHQDQIKCSSDAAPS